MDDFKLLYPAGVVEIRKYAKQLQFKSFERIAESAGALLKQWHDEGSIKSRKDFDDAILSLKAALRSKKAELTVNPQKPETLCWTCANAVPAGQYNIKTRSMRYFKGCSWSIRHIPVDGWDATPNGNSFAVHKCPLFKKG